MNTCVGLSIKYFGAKVAQLYSSKFDGEETQKATKVMIENLRDSFAELIQGATWMDEKTRSKALNKLAQIKSTDGFSKNLTDHAVAHVYQGFDETINYSTFLTNVVKMQTFWSKKEVNRMLEKPTYNDDINALGFDTSLVNAMYSPEENSIWIPLGIQNPPFYAGHQVQSLNYGAIGMVLGHELTHGFDNMGRQFDKYGNYENWWSNETSARFVDRQRCFVEQYGNFSFQILEQIAGYEGPTNVSGTQTLGENIADNGGIREAFMAYHKYLDKKAVELSLSSYKEPALPGLSSFTSDQLFFIGYARGWCEAKTLSDLVGQLQGDPHPPAMVRVLLTLKNNEDFKQAFQCQAGDRMISENPCRVW